MINFRTNHKGTRQTDDLIRKSWASLMDRHDLGFWQLPERDAIWKDSATFARQLKKSSRKLVVLGMGGSALGGRCLVNTLCDTDSVVFLNSSDPDGVGQFLNNDKLLRSACFLVISKSGGTLEIACLLDLLLQSLKRVGRSFKKAVAVISEPTNNPLTTWARAEDLPFLAHPEDVGGRFSAFTPVGLVPAAYAGVSLSELRKGLRLALRQNDFAFEMAAFYFESFARQEWISYFWPYIDRLSSFADWCVQVWAESLAKKLGRRGQQAPQVSAPVFCFGARDQHSVLQQLIEGKDKISVCFFRQEMWQNKKTKLTGNPLPGFEYLRNKNLQEVYGVQSQSTQMSLEKVGRKTCSVDISQLNAGSLSYLMMSLELVIGLLGESLEINAFDQPGVEIGKKIALEKLQQNTRI